MLQARSGQLLLSSDTPRKTQKDKFGNKPRAAAGSRSSPTPRWKAKLKVAKRNRDYLKAIEIGEQVLCRNPWDLGTQMDMAEAFDALGLSDLAGVHARPGPPKVPQRRHHSTGCWHASSKSRGDFQRRWCCGKWSATPTRRTSKPRTKRTTSPPSATIQKGQYEEAASGTKESPVVGRIESRAAEKQDKLPREADPILKRIEADPTEPSLYLQLASLYRKSGQTDRARAVLQQGLGPTGNAFQIQLELMELDLAPVRKNLEHAEQRLRKLKEKKPSADADETPKNAPAEEMSEAELTALRIKLLKEVNSREIELFRVKADRFPNEVNHRIELGTRLLKADRIDEAIAELQQARRDERYKWRAALLLGLCFKKRSNWRWRNATSKKAWRRCRKAKRPSEGAAVPTRQRRGGKRRPPTRHRPRSRTRQPRLQLQEHRQTAGRME